MKPVSKPLIVLTLGIAVFAVVACVAAFIPTVGGPSTPKSIVSLRGETVPLFGSGLYRWDSVSFATQARAQDTVTLVIGVPLLLVSLFFSIRGSLRSALLLAGTLAYFSYTYATYAFGLQYNSFFLVYVALLSMGVTALTLSLFRLEPEEIKKHFTGPKIRWGAVIFDFFVGFMLLLMWLGRIISNKTMIEHYTTLPIQVMDLAFVVPLAVWAGYFLARDKPLGYLLTGLFLMKGLTLALALGAMILLMALSGLPVNGVETVVFLVIIGGGLGISVGYLRSIR